MYNKDEVYKATLEYFGGDELATDVWIKKYALTDKEGNYLELTPDDMHRRLAREFARMEAKFGGEGQLSEEEIYGYLKGFSKIVPQGSPMALIGNNYVKGSISNCVIVSSPDDNMSDIFSAAKDLANLTKVRCGCGIDISTLRPEGASVSNAAKTSSGAWSFADFYSYVIRMVGQLGRRGALLVSMDVRHPDIEKFITCKTDLTKVTGANISVQLCDEFMNAVKNDEKFLLRWPVDSSEPKITREVNAKDVWDLIIETAKNTAEPGLLNADHIRRRLPANCYDDFKYVTVNPCFSGDTMVAVADGRNEVSIKQLAEEGKDVPVYSVDQKTGKVSVKWGRNPRVTGHKKQLMRVTLDDGSYVDVTPNHKFPLMDGTEKRAEELVSGDRLYHFVKDLFSVKDGDKIKRQYYSVKIGTNEREFEHRIVAKFFNPAQWREVYKKGFNGDRYKDGLVVHHKDYDSLNNNPDNLQIMTFKDHSVLHANNDNNGMDNGKYSGHTNQDIEHKAIELCEKLGRRFSKKEWIDFCDVERYPKSFSEWRREGWFKSVVDLGKWAAQKAGVGEHNNEDPRTVKTLLRAMRAGYDAKVDNGQVYVGKVCEGCESVYWCLFNKREQGYCSPSCFLEKHNSSQSAKEQRLKASNKAREAIAKNNMDKQAKIYSALRYKLKREPLRKEWEEECKKNSVPFRTGTKFGYGSYREVQDAGQKYNHRVSSVKMIDGLHTVYNITVDDNHTLATITSRREDSVGGYVYDGIFSLQCGEVPLSPYDSCRLISLNLKNIVVDRFSENAHLDLDALYKNAYVGQRLSDDLVELEMEKLQRLIDEADTEEERVLFKKLLWSCNNGRRTGLGTHGLADAISGCCARYDSEDGIGLMNQIYKTVRDAAYQSSVDMAKERGAFPVWNWEFEKDNEYINDLEPDLSKEMSVVGRRNISLLTNAPTGSVSIVSQTSSGIEPVFRNSYSRRKKKNHNETSDESDYVDITGDRWTQFEVKHHSVKEWMELNPGKDLPEYFVTSDQIDWEKRIEGQAAIQHWIDHALSNTVNLPKGTGSDVVGKVYMKAWETGCKGVTAYVDQSREGVLLSGEAQPKKDNYTKRPADLPCEIHQASVKGEKWTILVGLLNNTPYEIFAGRSELIEIPKKYKEGQLIKCKCGKSKNRYDLKISDEWLIKDVIKVFDNPDNGVFTRLLSLSLRHGAGVNYVMEQLQKDTDSDFTSLSKVLARVLKKYVADGTKVSTDKACPECGDENLHYAEGCVQCSSCGWTKCQ